MDPQAVFDKYLLNEDRDGAFNWVAEKLAWDPEAIHLRGMMAFAFRLNEQYGMSRSMAEEVLKEDPSEEWALATVFSTAHNVERVFDQFSFFDDNGFRLSHEWIARFHCLGHKDEARKVLYCLSRYGSPLQKAVLSEDWLVTDGVERYDEKQLELDLEQKNSGGKAVKKRPRKWG